MELTFGEAVAAARTALFDGASPFGHAAYLALTLSYLVSSMLWLRVLAVVGIVLEMIYFAYSGGDLGAGLAWSGIFVAINLFHIGVILRGRFGLAISPDQRAFLRATFPVLDPARLVRLLACGGFEPLPAGAVLTEEGRPVTRLFVVRTGRCAVVAGGREVARRGTGLVVGEMAFLTGRPASATVTMAEDGEVLALDPARLAAEARRDDVVSTALYRLLGEDLARKLAAANERGTDGSTAAAEPVADGSGQGRATAP